MRNKGLMIAIILVNFLFAGNLAYASFPVEPANSDVVAEQVDSNVAVEDESGLTSPASTLGGDVLWIALLLWLFLGGFAAHRWYAGKPVGWNILFILTGGGLMIWALVDLVMMFTGSFFD